jgi:hypothetical protein
MNHDELDLIRSIAADTPDPDPAAIRAARARLLTVIAAETTTRPRPRRRAAAGTAGRVRLRRLLPGSVMVAAALTTALAAPLLLQRPATLPPSPTTGTTPPGRPGTAPALDRVLATAALAAASAPAPEFGPGKYWYIRERGVKLGSNLDRAGSRRNFFYRFGYRSQTWWALDGSLSGQLRNGPARFLDQRQRAAWMAAGRPDLGLPNTEVYSPKVKQRIVGIGWLPSSYQDLVALPTDPATLLAALTKRIRTGSPPGLPAGSTSPTSRTQLLFGTIGYLLEHYPLPPQLRAGLYQVLTRLEGVRLVGNVTDLAGRHGVAVAVDIDRPLHERNELLLEPATGRLLGTRTVLTRRVPGWPLPAGTVVDQRVFLQAAVVDSRTTRPHPPTP